MWWLCRRVCVVAALQEFVLCGDVAEDLRCGDDAEVCVVVILQDLRFGDVAGCCVGVAL